MKEYTWRWLYRERWCRARDYLSLVQGKGLSLVDSPLLGDHSIDSVVVQVGRILRNNCLGHHYTGPWVVKLPRVVRRGNGTIRCNDTSGAHTSRYRRVAID